MATGCFWKIAKRVALLVIPLLQEQLSDTARSAPKRRPPRVPLAAYVRIRQSAPRHRSLAPGLRRSSQPTVSLVESAEASVVGAGVTDAFVGEASTTISATHADDGRI
jgi:hypothetical protein